MAQPINPNDQLAIQLHAQLIEQLKARLPFTKLVYQTVLKTLPDIVHTIRNDPGQTNVFQRVTFRPNLKPFNRSLRDELQAFDVALFQGQIRVYHSLVEELITNLQSIIQNLVEHAAKSNQDYHLILKQSAAFIDEQIIPTNRPPLYYQSIDNYVMQMTDKTLLLLTDNPYERN